jgi:ketosteroid isomerase-like protein
MTEILQDLMDAMNGRDARKLADLFAPDYVSEQPLHPNRCFGGSEQVLANWTSVFDGVPDFSADLLSSATDGDRIWTEWRWHGTHADGSTFLMGGVILPRLRVDRIAETRLYMEPVEPGGEKIDAAVRKLYRAPDKS